MQHGEVRTGLDLLVEARGLAEGPEFSDIDRAEIVFRQGVARYLISSIATSVALFREALNLLDRSELPSDLLRAGILTWRSRCYRRQRDYEAAREDVERSLELAEAMQDPLALGEAYFQASLIAERDGHWVLARTFAERAKTQYEVLADRSNVGRLLNNLGGLEFLLGKPEEAIARLQEAFAVALDHGTDDDIATILSSLAQVYLKTGDPVTAEEHAPPRATAARRARGSGRRDRQRAARPRARTPRRGPARGGRGNAGRVRAVPLPAVVRPPPRGYGRVGRARATLATRRGDDRQQAAALYRRAAEALQDFPGSNCFQVAARLSRRQDV